MGKVNLTFDNTEIKKINFTAMALLFFDIEKVLVSNKISIGEKYYKYFIGS